VAAVNPAAAAAGLAPGMPLADALSFLPGLATAAAEPEADAAALRRLAEWCGRYSPWTAPDGADAVKIEITGCAHLWGGERALAADLAARLERCRIANRIAVADTTGAAWALARFAAGAGPLLAAPAGQREALAPLPVTALRLDPATAAGLSRVGLKRIGDLYPMPRDALARRFGDGVARRLDQALGDAPEPLSPLGQAPTRRVRLSFAEPIADPADLAQATRRLCEDLALRLAREGLGARRLDLAFHRVDGRVERLRLGTARASRDPRHLAGLFIERLDTIDPGLGVEDMILAVYTAEQLPAENLPLPPTGGEGRVRGPTAGVLPLTPALSPQAGRGREPASLAPLLDRLGNRLGLDALTRCEARASHIPERASARVPAGAGPRPAAAPAVDKPPRPVRLFEPPQPVEALSLLPDMPPFRFTWRRRRHDIRRADGPERIAAEWWPDGDDMVRDYYRVEDQEGHRFWLFRAGLWGEGPAPSWYVHGVFA
jgi:protein ImuB